MDDRVGPRFEHRLVNGARVEQIELDRLCPELPEVFGPSGRSVRSDHLVPVIDQLRNEPGADRTARSCHEDSHGVLLFLVTSA
jgi:hypothetical protein